MSIVGTLTKGGREKSMVMVLKKVEELKDVWVLRMDEMLERRVLEEVCMHMWEETEKRRMAWIQWSTSVWKGSCKREEVVRVRVEERVDGDDQDRDDGCVAVVGGFWNDAVKKGSVQYIYR